MGNLKASKHTHTHNATFSLSRLKKITGQAEKQRLAQRKAGYQGSLFTFAFRSECGGVEQSEINQASLAESDLTKFF